MMPTISSRRTARRKLLRHNTTSDEITALDIDQKLDMDRRETRHDRAGGGQWLGVAGFFQLRGWGSGGAVGALGEHVKLYVCGVHSHRVDAYLSSVWGAGGWGQGGHRVPACWALCERPYRGAHRFLRRRLVCWMRPLAFFEWRA